MHANSKGQCYSKQPAQQMLIVFIVQLCFDVVLHVEDGLSGHTVEDAAVIGWGEQLEVSVPTGLQDEHIKDCHFLDVVVEQPQDIIKAVHLGISD